MCKALKSRDACYFACNFVLDSRKPREIELTEEEKNRYGEQISMFKENDDMAIICKAIEHLDMDMIRYYVNKVRIENRKELWEALKEYSLRNDISDEINALEQADLFVNRNKKNGAKDEIFIAKAIMLLCYDNDANIDDVSSSEIVKLHGNIDWSPYNEKISPVEKYYCESYVIPEWVFDCHTLKGKRMGKTDWDMTLDEQAALYPKANDYFGNASWIYIYAQDVRDGDLSEEEFEVIKEFGKTHEANPVKFIPYS